MKKSLLLSLVILFTGLVAVAQEKKDSIILTIAGENIPKSEFERVFKKNNSKDTMYDSKSVNEYLQLYINYKLKVREALELGMDTVKSFTDELSGYRKQLAQPYLVDKQVSEKLLKEAYERLKMDVRASHILIKVEPNALPKDTLEAYNKAMKIRGELIKGADFANAAKKYSDDPSAKDNGGDLGYFTALQMVYPFEVAVFAMKENETSQPVRTRFGYHIIRLNEKRPSHGEVKVAHIMVKTAANLKPEDSLKAQMKINEIYSKLKAGDKFEELARQFSDDQTSSKNGGVLPMFGTGRMVPEFERAAFSLKYPGDYTEPVRTSYGFHIIKLLETKPLAKYEEMMPDLKQRVQKDSRSELSRSSLIDRVKKKYNFKEEPKAKDEFMKVVDSTLAQGKWTAEKAEKLNATMFAFGPRMYSQHDFAKYLADHQTRHESGLNPKVLAENSYNDWINETAIAYEETKLDSLYPDFRNLMQEYRDGILLFELTDKKVWSKAVKDTTGLRGFYELNKMNYMWTERVEANIYSCASEDIAAQTRKLMKKIEDSDTLMSRLNKASQLNLQVKYGKFAKGDNDIVDKVAPWKVGITPNVKTDNLITFVDVKKVLPPNPKSLEEAKGLITADYQNQLEKEWIASLKTKYKVVVHQDVVETIANK